MKLFSKIAVMAVSFAAAALYGAETINIADPAFIRPVFGKATIANNEIKHVGKTFLFGSKHIAVDPAKKYTFKYTIVNNSDKVVTVYGGVDFYDANKKTYPSFCWQGNPATVTELAADAKAGDTEIKVKSATGWATHPATCIFRNAKKDSSDLPSPADNKIAESVKKVAKDGDVWILSLRAPLKKDIPAGTSIRQHFLSGYYYLNGAAPTRVAPKQSRTIISTISGYAAAAGRFNQKNWPAGAKEFIFIFLSDYADTKADITIKDASITVE